MLQDQFMADLLKAVRHVPQAENTLRLSKEQTLEFFGRRKIWGECGISVTCIEGKMVKLDLPSFPLPVRTITLEEYYWDDVNIVPDFQYHGIVNFFMSRRLKNLMPHGRKDNI